MCSDLPKSQDSLPRAVEGGGGGGGGGGLAWFGQRNEENMIKAKILITYSVVCVLMW